MSRTAWHRFLLVLASIVAVLAAVPVGSAATANEYSGRAAVVDATVFGKAGLTKDTNITIVDTGNLPATGGSIHKHLLAFNEQLCAEPVDVMLLPDCVGSVGAEVAHASTVGQGNKSSSRASLASLAFDVGGVKIGAEFLSAEAEAVCEAGTAVVSGRTEIVELNVAGITIVLPEDVPENYDVVANTPGLSALLPAGTKIVLNETKREGSGNYGKITVNALHVFIPGVANVVIASAEADIKCAQSPPAGCDSDRVTGGGWYYWLGDRVHFALAARNLSSWGHLMYMHKAIDLKVHGTPLTADMSPTPGSKNDGFGDVEGTASANRTFTIGGVEYSVGYFLVKFLDAGEPGRNDKFAIILLTAAPGAPGSKELYRVGFDASGNLISKLEGGNLQYHNCK